MVRTKHDAEDVVSECVLVAFERFEKLRDHQAFASYLFTIASRIVKRRRWRRRLFQEMDPGADDLIEIETSTQEILTDVSILRSVLVKLPQKTREAIIMFEINGFSIEEIRVVQGGTVSGVKSRLKRGRERLTRLLETRTHPDVTIESQQSVQPQSLIHPKTVL
jgi:RNA polymerase sigma-70 factor (ECF subfamily)